MLKRVLLITFTLVGVSILPLTMSTSMAQDEKVECNSEDMTTSITASQDLLGQAQTAIANGDLAMALTLLEETQRQITNGFSLCKGWYFEGEGPDALGPFELEAGVYIVDYASEIPEGSMPMGLFSIEFENLDQEEMIWDSVMEMRTEAGPFDGRQTVKLEGGRYMISVDATGITGWSFGLSKP